MAVSNINAIINKDIHKVWDIVFAVEKYSEWRSDLSKTEIINEKQFIEYTKDGYATTFSITTIEPYKRWEFDMENSNMSGHWIGVFTAKGNETQIDFTENVTPLAGRTTGSCYFNAFFKSRTNCSCCFFR